MHQVPADHLGNQSTSCSLETRCFREAAPPAPTRPLTVLRLVGEQQDGCLTPSAAKMEPRRGGRVSPCSRFDSPPPRQHKNMQTLPRVLQVRDEQFGGY